MPLRPLSPHFNLFRVEMEFLDIKFNKQLESFAPSYSQSFLLAVLKKSLIMNSIL
jgi:hypothetical protein